MFHFLKQLYTAYCKKTVLEHDAEDWNIFLHAEARKKILQPQLKSIHAFLKTIKSALEVHHEKTLAHGWLNMGYNQKQNQAQWNHFQAIRTLHSAIPSRANDRGRAIAAHRLR
jgi:hypothetical protein